MSESSYDCAECGANLCIHTVAHIERLSSLISHQEVKIKELNKMVELLTQIKSIGKSENISLE